MDKHLIYPDAVAFVARYGITPEQFHLAHQHDDTLPPFTPGTDSKGLPARYYLTSLLIEWAQNYVKTLQAS